MLNFVPRPQIVSTKFFFLLGLYWMTLGPCRYCTARYQKIWPPDWRCDDGQFISKRYVCDGVPTDHWFRPQCSDGSDESLATCCASTCPSDPDICIPADEEILPSQDCRNCTTYWDEGAVNGRPGWRCNSGQCLDKGWVCNGSPNCLDGSDESPTTCCASTCPSDPDICIQAGHEIKPGQDCRDCLEDYGWRCNSGQCVHKRNVCDGFAPHCSDGSDEAPSTCCASTCPSDPDICIPTGQEIKPGEDCRNCTDIYGDPGWRCNSGQCLEKKYVCNDSPDCSDVSDESPTGCCASTCPSDPDICIPAAQQIKPGQDCRDCTNIWGGPGWAGWRCNSGQCLKNFLVCDGSPECSDGSDESPATCCPSTCPSDPDICIQAGQEVKPGQDCRDCTHRYGDPGWRCNSGQCLRKSDVCNGGKPDCSDGSDESPLTCSPSWFTKIIRWIIPT